MLRDTYADLDSSKVFWRVLLASGEQVMTLDELDAAFDAGRVDAATRVCAPGSSEFVRLGAIAGLDEEADEAVSVDVDFGANAHACAPEAEGAKPAASRVFDLHASIDEAPAFRPRFRYRRLFAIPAVAALIAVLACAAHASTSSEPPATAVRSAIAPAPMPAPSPVELPPEAAPAAASPAPTLSEAQKKALAARDKKAEAARNAKRAAVAPKRPTKKSASPFVKGGSKHDPMNASL